MHHMKKAQVKLFRNEIPPFLEILSVFFTVSIDGFRRIICTQVFTKACTLNVALFVQNLNL